MASAEVTPRLSIRTRSIVRAWLIIILPVLIGTALISSSRILMWIATGATIAALLYPIAEFFMRAMPRVLAVLLTMLLFWATFGFATYSVLGDLTGQARNLQEAAPRIIARYETGSSAGAHLARDAHLDKRAQVFFSELPDRLRGGPPAKAIRGVATRAVITLVINVLAIFFMLHMGKLTQDLLGVIPDDVERARWKRVIYRTYERSFIYLRGSVGMAILAGVFAYMVARAANVPSPFPLAVFAGVLDFVPLFGVFLGGLPIALLAAARDEQTAIVILILFIVYQVLESVFVQRDLEKQSVRPGPFISFVALFGGLEAFGAGGMFLGLVLGTLLVTFLDEVFPDTSRMLAPGESSS